MKKRTIVCIGGQPLANKEKKLKLTTLGFTLIELLAVIVILAIIALIATPIILGIINNVKDESNKRSIEMYANAIENAIVQYQMKENKIPTTPDEIEKYIQYKGEEITCDKLEIYEDGNIYLDNCNINGKEVEYTYGKKQVVPESFAEDSWETIAKAVKDGNTSVYKVGDTKEISLVGFTNEEPDSNGLYTIRIANKSSSDEICKNDNYSKTACGFVIEFVDIITTHNMNPSGEYKGIQYDKGWNVDGYPTSAMYIYIQNNIYNALPEDLKKEIILTKVVSGHGSTEGEINFISSDKLYLLSTKEIYGKKGGSGSNIITHDTAEVETRQLDYYESVANVTTSNYSGAIKNYNGSAYYWWLRTARSNCDNLFYRILPSGYTDVHYANDVRGVAPAFRIG